MRFLPWLAAASFALPLTLTACDDKSGDGISAEEGQLSDLEPLLAGAPDPAKLPDEPKADATYPAQFDVATLQSPVRNQASRGVCSIFSTVALMEHLYIKEGKLSNPDFSEQFLQWSAKAEVGAFTTTEGSNPDRNIEAIQKFGIVAESDWPYQTSRWSTLNDPACTGEGQPIKCYTNGEPPEAAKAATRYKLPAVRYVSNRRQSIKAFMVQNKQAVTATMTFFYQSWNHRGGPLPVNGEYARQGYILAPNAKDIEESKKKPAGHSILIVGWDDDLAVQTVDELGNKVVDADGKPVMERGFFLIKNSWGTTNFGLANRFGPGYGWLSMKYVEQYANINGADVPKVDLGPEVCDDGKDNNQNRLIDCEDIETCGKNTACLNTDFFFESKPNKAIPDNNAGGLGSDITVGPGGTVTSAWVEVEIAHPFVRDLKLVVTLPSGRAITMYDHNDIAGRDMKRRFTLPAVIGEQAGGTWRLTVSDNAQGDVGKLERWAVGVSVAQSALVEVCGDGQDNDGDHAVDCADSDCATTAACQTAGPDVFEGSAEPNVSIPDQDAAGVKSKITLSGKGSVAGVTVDVGITHSYRGDLTVKLVAPSGKTVTLLDQQGGSADDVDQTFESDAFDGLPAAGEWTLWVTDGFAGDTGTLDLWFLSVDVE